MAGTAQDAVWAQFPQSTRPVLDWVWQAGCVVRVPTVMVVILRAPRPP